MELWFNAVFTAKSCSQIVWQSKFNSGNWTWLSWSIHPRGSFSCELNRTELKKPLQDHEKQAALPHDDLKMSQNLNSQMWRVHTTGCQRGDSSPDPGKELMIWIVWLNSRSVLAGLSLLWTFLVLALAQCKGISNWTWSTSWLKSIQTFNVLRLTILYVIMIFILGECCGSSINQTWPMQWLHPKHIKWFKTFCKRCWT